VNGGPPSSLIDIDTLDRLPTHDIVRIMIAHDFTLLVKSIICGPCFSKRIAGPTMRETTFVLSLRKYA
jgi:hypothetical protein